MLIMMCCRRFSVTCTSGSRSQRVVAPDCQIARREHFHHRRPGAAEAVRSLADSPAGRHPPEGLAVAPARELAARLHLHEAVRWQRLAEGDERLEDGDALAKPFRGVREPSRRPGSSLCSGAQAWMQHSAGTCPNSWRDGFARDCPLRHPVAWVLALRDRSGAHRRFLVVCGAISAVAGEAPEKRGTTEARWQPVCRRSSREPGFVVRGGRSRSVTHRSANKSLGMRDYPGQSGTDAGRSFQDGWPPVRHGRDPVLPEQRRRRYRSPAPHREYEITAHFPRNGPDGAEPELTAPLRQVALSAARRQACPMKPGPSRHADARLQVTRDREPVRGLQHSSQPSSLITVIARRARHDYGRGRRRNGLFLVADRQRDRVRARLEVTQGHAQECAVAARAADNRLVDDLQCRPVRRCTSDDKARPHGSLGSDGHQSIGHVEGVRQLGCTRASHARFLAAASRSSRPQIRVNTGTAVPLLALGE